jgi:membrane associated rhomboid family serine protease
MGASGAVSGLFGGALRFLILEPRRAILAAIVWLIFTVLFGVIGAEAFGEGSSIAWEAHVGGFVAGLVLFPLFDRRRT